MTDRIRTISSEREHNMHNVKEDSMGTPIMKQEVKENIADQFLVNLAEKSYKIQIEQRKCNKNRRKNRELR